MRLLADENFPRQSVVALRDAGHDVIWVRTDLSGARDIALIEHAEDDGRLLLTLDKDFWQLTMQSRSPITTSGVLLFRIHPPHHKALTPVVLRVLEDGERWIGCMSVVTPDAIFSVKLNQS